jgi:CRISPR-associated Cas5-like protein
VKRTRLAAAFILELFGNGWTREEVLESYPQLSPESLQACFAYASEVIAEYRSAVIPTPSAARGRNPSNCEPNL